MCARVPQAMAQFFLKIEKLSHIMGTAPIVELARAYGLHPRLWLLAKFKMCQENFSKISPIKSAKLFAAIFSLAQRACNFDTSAV